MKQSRYNGRFQAYNDNELWEIYNEAYNKEAEKPGGMHQTRFASKSEFVGELVMARNEGIKVNASYVRAVAKSQKYKLSTAQARALQPALKIASVEAAERKLKESDKLSKGEITYLKRVIKEGGVNYTTHQIQSGFGHVGASLQEISSTYHELRTGDMAFNPETAAELLKQKYQFRSPDSP